MPAIVGVVGSSRIEHLLRDRNGFVASGPDRILYRPSNFLAFASSLPPLPAAFGIRQPHGAKNRCNRSGSLGPCSRLRVESIPGQTENDADDAKAQHGKRRYGGKELGGGLNPCRPNPPRYLHGLFPLGTLSITATNLAYRWPKSPRIKSHRCELLEAGISKASRMWVSVGADDRFVSWIESDR